MNRISAPFSLAADTPVRNLGDGIRRQLLGFEPSLLVARVWFEKGAVGEIHAHPHAQMTYVESGIFEYRVGDEVRRLEAGDCARVSPDTMHGTTCLEAGVLIDVFSPCRDDFLTDTAQ